MALLDSLSRVCFRENVTPKAITIKLSVTHVVTNMVKGGVRKGYALLRPPQGLMCFGACIALGTGLIQLTKPMAGPPRIPA